MQKQRHTEWVLGHSAYVPSPGFPSQAQVCISSTHRTSLYDSTASAAQGGEELSHSNKNKETSAGEHHVINN